MRFNVIIYYLVTDIMSVLRSLKNVAHSYTEWERDVREATSNDAWGASTRLLMKICDEACDLCVFKS